MQLNGSQIVIETLIEQGVDTIFGYPGGAILNIYDELYKNSARIRHVLTAHEQGASHAADGYARSTGKTGVVFATSGPGATNLVTGIATAYMDSVPLIAITCNVGTPLLGKDSFQEVDIAGVTMPITKHNFIVRDVNRLADIIRQAFRIANSGRPGPVLIDIPKDITAAVAEFTPLSESEKKELFTKDNYNKFSSDDIKAAAELINSAQRPVIYCGGGVSISGAEKELLELAEKANIPVAVSLMGKTAIASTHPLCTGMIGMHGTKASNTAVSQSDLLIAIGARFSDRVISNPKTFAKNSKVLHIDIDPAEINKNIQTYASVIGDVKAVLKELNPLVNERKATEWNDKVNEWKKNVPPMYTALEDLHPKAICEYVHSKIDGNEIVTTEVGQHQMWIAQFYPFTTPRSFLTSGGLGTMGYGTGAAIGAQVGNPIKHVVHFAGDGSFRMICNELATIGHYQLPIIIIILDNGVLGMVRQWQNLFYEKRFSQTTLDFGPDFVKLAEAYGISGIRVSKEADFKAAFDKALESGKPAIIDCAIPKDEMVLPMVPGGKSIDNLIMEVES